MRGVPSFVVPINSNDLSLESRVSEIKEATADALEGWRWHFAGLIMAAITGALISNPDKRVPLQAAALAAGFADELIAELEKTQS